VDVVFRAVVRGRSKVRGEARVTVARPITSLAVVAERPRMRSGDTMEIRIEGRTDARGESVPVPSRRIRVTLDGPGKLEPASRDGRYRYRAPGRVDADTPVTVRARLRGKDGVHGETRFTVRPRVNLVGIEIVASRTRLRPGEEAELRIVPRGDHPRIPLSADDVALALAVRGGELRRVGPGRWRWKAPADIAGRREFAVRGSAPDEPKVGAVARILVERPGLPASHPIDVDDLFVITEWKVDVPVFGRSDSQPLPKGRTFKAPSRKITFRGRILREDVQSVVVTLEREGSKKVKTYPTTDDHLKVKQDDKGRWEFRFQKDFSHRKTKYTVSLLVTTTAGRTYRDVFLVKTK
jgi:hypothetical protein